MSMIDLSTCQKIMFSCKLNIQMKTTFSGRGRHGVQLYNVNGRVNTFLLCFRDLCLCMRGLYEVEYQC